MRMSCALLARARQPLHTTLLSRAPRDLLRAVSSSASEEGGATHRMAPRRRAVLGAAAAGAANGEGVRLASAVIDSAEESVEQLEQHVG